MTDATAERVGMHLLGAGRLDEAQRALDGARSLRGLDENARRQIDQLERALSFVEVFRFLYQLLEVQEEEILLADEGSRSQLDAVAELMGYKDVGVVRGCDHLLIHYHEHVQTARAVAAELIADLRRRVAEELNPLFKIHDLVVVDALPRTASNKLMRRTLRSRYRG